MLALWSSCCLSTLANTNWSKTSQSSNRIVRNNTLLISQPLDLQYQTTKTQNHKNKNKRTYPVWKVGLSRGNSDWHGIWKRGTHKDLYWKGKRGFEKQTKKIKDHFLGQFYLIIKHIERQTFVCLHILFILYNNSIFKMKMRTQGWNWYIYSCLLIQTRYYEPSVTWTHCAKTICNVPNRMV